MKKRLWLFSVIILILCYIVYLENKTEANNPNEMTMKIRLIFDDTTLTATMYDNPTAKDFISLLPLTLKLEDYTNTEKISNLPKNYLQRRLLRAVILLLDISLITLHGETWLYFIEILDTQADLLSSER